MQMGPTSSGWGDDPFDLQTRDGPSDDEERTGSGCNERAVNRFIAMWFAVWFTMWFTSWRHALNDLAEALRRERSTNDDDDDEPFTPIMTRNEVKHRYDEEKRWYDEEHRLHRVGGPAVMRANGDVEFWHHGRLHRMAGPAIIRANGCRRWMVHGRLHRTDGPALIQGDGTEMWFHHGGRVK